MKIAAICLAHAGNPAGVDCLAEYFGEAETRLFVHVDAKTDDAPYREIAARWPGVTLLTHRLPVYWGGFNIVRAVVRAFEEARTGGNYDRYLLLSEDSVPLLSRAEYVRRMNSEVEFIECHKASGPKVIARYERFFYFDSGATSSRPCTVLDREVTADTLLAFSRLQSLRARGKAVLPALYHGSQWFALTSARVDAILESYHGDSYLRESFEFSAIPDEQYFQTILGGIPGSQRFIFADFSRAPQPYVFRTYDEIQACDARGCLFLRKVPLGHASVRAFVRDLG